jgi:hypothetical protein
MLMPESAALWSIVASTGIIGRAEGANACAADAAHTATLLANKPAQVAFITVGVDAPQ